jgi:hypothetical protein
MLVASKLEMFWDYYYYINKYSLNNNINMVIINSNYYYCYAVILEPKRGEKCTHYGLKTCSIETISNTEALVGG